MDLILNHITEHCTLHI